MTTNELHELILACRDLATMHTPSELKEIIADAIDAGIEPSLADIASLADTLIDGSMETDADDDIESPLDADPDLARDLLAAMLEIRLRPADL